MAAAAAGLCSAVSVCNDRGELLTTACANSLLLAFPALVIMLDLAVVGTEFCVAVLSEEGSPALHADALNRFPLRHTLRSVLPMPFTAFFRTVPGFCERPNLVQMRFDFFRVVISRAPMFIAR